MAIIRKDIGGATAYAAAVEAGYTGTKAEFEALMASYATVGEQANANALKAEGNAVGKQNGTDVGSDSPYYHNNAKYYAGQASGSASDAAQSASAAAGSAQQAAQTVAGIGQAGAAQIALVEAAGTAQVGAVNTAGTTQKGLVQAEGTAQVGAVADKGAEVLASIPSDYTTLSGNVDDLMAEIVDKADKIGSYPQFTAGTAEQLLPTTYGTDNAPYLFRTSGGSADVGDREAPVLKGGTVAWNQQFQKNPVSIAQKNNADITYDSSTDSLTIVSTKATSDVKRIRFVMLNTNTVYLASGSITNNFNLSDSILPAFGFFATSEALAKTVKSTTYQQTVSGAVIIKSGDGHDSSNTHFFGARIPNSATADNGNAVLKNIQLFNLTQMFGSAIADYILALETATAGAGVSYFRKLFPKPYYPYNIGELLSVKTSGHIMTGFNQWDEQWEVGALDTTDGTPTYSTTTIRSTNFCPCIGSATYYLKCANYSDVYALCIYWYDADNTFISRAWACATTATAPVNARYFKIVTNSSGTVYGTTYRNDICVNLSHSGYRNGEYEPYEQYSYPLDSDLELRGIPKLDSNNKLYYDGDSYEPDGTVTRRYGVVDLGTLNWNYQSANLRFWSDGIKTSVKTTSDDWSCPFVCSKYKAIIWNSSDDKFITLANSLGRVFLKDTAYTDSNLSNGHASWLEGVYLVYELATTTTETADPFSEYQIVNDFGTEAFTDSRTVAVPVGHETKYPENSRAKLDGLPWNFATLIAPTEQTYKATRAYTSGQLFIVNNILYKATASIANGATITPGTNATATTLAEIISAL